MSSQRYSCCHRPKNPAAFLLINSNEPLVSPGREAADRADEIQVPGVSGCSAQNKELAGSCRACALPLLFQGREERESSAGL